MSEQPAVQSLSRAFGLIELLCQNGPMGISELSASSGLHKTTVYRLLSTLSDLGYIEKNPQTEKYAPTLRFLTISSALLAQNDIRRMARPFLEKLPVTLGETVHLVQRSGSQIVYIDKFESSQNSVQMVSRIGLSLPMICTAVGKAILARMPDTEIRAVWEQTEIVRHTPKTITDSEAFFKEIQTVREQGYAVDDEENELGVRCIAAAIPDVYGDFNFAFSVSAPISRMKGDKMEKTIELVTETRDAMIGINR